MIVVMLFVYISECQYCFAAGNKHAEQSDIQHALALGADMLLMNDRLKRRDLLLKCLHA